MIEKIMQEMGLPLLFTVLLLYYAIKLLVFQDIESIRPKGRPPIQDKKGYGREATRFSVLRWFFWDCFLPDCSLGA